MLSAGQVSGQLQFQKQRRGYWWCWGCGQLVLDEGGPDGVDVHLAAGDVILFENDLPDMYAEDNEPAAAAPAAA